MIILLKGSLYYRKSRGDRYITRQNVPWIKTRNVINEMGYRLHLYIEWQRVNEPRSIAGLISAQWNQSLEHFPLGSRNTVRWVGVVLSRIFVERYQRPTIQHWSVASFQITRSVFTWRHSSRDWRVISPDIFDPVPPRDRASKKVTTGSRSSCMKHNSVLCPSLFLSPHCPHRFSKSSFLDSIFNPFDWTKFGTTLETP